MGELQKRTKIPIVDESVQTMEDINRLGKAGEKWDDLKLMKVGGLRRWWRCWWRAREFGMSVMLGCMIETSIGTTAMGAFVRGGGLIDSSCR